MSALTPDTKEPSRRLPSAEGVVPAPSKEKNMPRMAQPTDNVTPQQQEAIDRLNALEPGDSVNNGVAWYENTGPGLWSTDPDSKSTEVHTSREIILEATKALNVDRASREIALPPKVMEPRLASFVALAGRGVDVEFIRNVTDDTPNPFVTGPCPAWCKTGATKDKPTPFHAFDPRGNDKHRSAPIVTRLITKAQVYGDGTVHLPSLQVFLTQAAEVPGSPVWVRLNAWKWSTEDQEITNTYNEALLPAQARELARALLAAADLADPDTDFEESK